jgi:MFS family permease
LIHKQIESDQQAWARDGKWQLFTVPTYRRRIVLGFLLLMGGQNIGILVINNFNVLLYKSLGLNGTASLAVAASWNTTALVANFLGAIFADRLGRRVDLGESDSCLF